MFKGCTPIVKHGDSLGTITNEPTCISSARGQLRYLRSDEDPFPVLVRVCEEDYNETHGAIGAFTNMSRGTWQVHANDEDIAIFLKQRTEDYARFLAEFLEITGPPSTDKQVIETVANEWAALVLRIVISSEACETPDPYVLASMFEGVLNRALTR